MYKKTCFLNDILVFYRYYQSGMDNALDDNKIEYVHNISIREIKETENYDSILEITEDEYNGFYYEDSENIEICNAGMKLDIIKKKFACEMYMHGTSAECDYSYPEFTYIDKLCTWIIFNGKIWGDENGLGCNGEIFIMDLTIEAQILFEKSRLYLDALIIYIPKDLASLCVDFIIPKFKLYI